VVRFRDGYGGGVVEKRAAQVMVEHGTLPLDELCFALKPPQALAPNPEGSFQRFRIGDAVASRTIHAAVYDALRLTRMM
jgi:hypothetical protein